MKRISLVVWLLFSSFICGIAQSETVKPILKDPVQTQIDLAPIGQTDEKYAGILSVSVKISVNGSSGSGTICYYDSKTGLAYVISCGHLLNGDGAYDPIKTKTKAKIILWYQNETKLDVPKTYDAEFLFWSNKRGEDVSLLVFKCDWTPNYCPISSEACFKPTPNLVLNSMGCDGGREVARYEVRFAEFTKEDLITKLNSPRPGRSGGGLITNEGELVGVCWGTTDVTSGGGVGFFTPLSAIEKVFVKNQHGWLVGVKSELETISIYDWDSPSKKYERHYVPVPNIPMLLF